MTTTRQPEPFLSSTNKVPSSIDAAIHQLVGVDALVTAKEWERAAIVAAFTEKGRPGPGDRTSSSAISVREFAALGIQGLRSQDTVRKYRQAWLSTGRPSAPGATVDLDGLGELGLDGRRPIARMLHGHG